MNPALAHLPKPPPRHVVEQDATQEQLILLWNAGYQDHAFLDQLGIDQARSLIARVSGAGPEPARERKRFPRRRVVGLLAIGLLGLAVLYLSLPPPEEAPAAASALPGASPEGEAEAGRTGPSGIIAPTSRRLSFSHIGKNLKRLRGRTATPATEKKATAPKTGKHSSRKAPDVNDLRVGKEFILRKPLGVKVREGVVVLQPGRPVTILERKGDRVVIRHDFGRAEASIRDLVP